MVKATRQAPEASVRLTWRRRPLEPHGDSGIRPLVMIHLASATGHLHQALDLLDTEPRPQLPDSTHLRLPRPTLDRRSVEPHYAAWVLHPAKSVAILQPLYEDARHQVHASPAPGEGLDPGHRGRTRDQLPFPLLILCWLVGDGRSSGSSAACPLPPASAFLLTAGRLPVQHRQRSSAHGCLSFSEIITGHGHRSPPDSVAKVSG